MNKILIDSLRLNFGYYRGSIHIDCRKMAYLISLSCFEPKLFIFAVNEDHDDITLLALR